MMPLAWIVVVALVAWAAVVLTRRNPGDGDGPGPAATRTEAPGEILDRRYAAGEIDAETYRRTRDHLAGRDVG